MKYEVTDEIVDIFTSIYYPKQYLYLKKDASATYKSVKIALEAVFEHLNHLEKKEPKKQTLLEFADDKFNWCKNKEEGNIYRTLKVISEYLEQNQ